MALKLHRSSVWTQNTNYVGVSGLHSEHKHNTSARNTHINRTFNVLITTMEDSEKKKLKIMNGNRKELEQSMLALSRRMHGINESRFSNNLVKKTNFSSEEISPRSDNSLSLTSSTSTFSFSSDGNSNSSVRQLPNIGVKRDRRTGVVLPPNIQELTILAEKDVIKGTTVSKDKAISGGSFDAQHDVIALRKPSLQISPFPDITDIENSIKKNSEEGNENSKLRRKSKRKKSRISRGQKKNSEVDKDVEVVRLSPHAKMVALQKLQIERQRKAALIAQQKRELLRKSRKEITESFRYSHAMGELINAKKSHNKNSNQEDSESIIIDSDGREIHMLGSSVLTVVNVDDNITGFKIRRRRHTTTGLGEKRPSFYRNQSRNSISSIYSPLPDIKKTELNKINLRSNEFYESANNTYTLPTLNETAGIEDDM